METIIKRYRILDYREFKKNYKGEYKDYIIKQTKQDALYKLEELNIVDLIKKGKIEFKEKIEIEEKYIEYVFTGTINLKPTKIILNIPTKILTKEYEYQQEHIKKYLKEIKETIKIKEKQDKKQNIETLKRIRNLIIASGLSTLILFKIEDNIEKQKKQNPNVRPKVVYETPTDEEIKPIDKIKRIKLQVK